MSAKPSGSNSASTVSRSELSKDTPTMNVVEINKPPKEIIAVIDSLKREVEAQRLVYIQKIMEENRQKLSAVTLAKERKNATSSDTNNSALLLIKRQTDAVNMHAFDVSSRESDGSGSQDDTTVLLGSNLPVKNSVRPIRLPEVKRLPPYTTWTFLDRNQRMPEDQSVVGRRRIYYDPSGGEALICSDSEEEVIEEEDKKEFVQSEDYILRMAALKVGLSDAVLDLLGQCFSKKPCDIKARYEILCGEGNAKTGLKGEESAEVLDNANPYLEKDLEGALDSFDNLFCRRCYVFDCRLHGCSQDLIFPTEKLLPWIAPEASNKPCGPDCYSTAKKFKVLAVANSVQCDDSEENPCTTSYDASVQLSPKRKSIGSGKKKGKYVQSESASSNAGNVSDSSDSDVTPGEDHNSIDESSILFKTKSKGKSGTHKNKNKRAADRTLVVKQKRQKKVNQDSDSVTSGGTVGRDMTLRPRTRKKDEDSGSSSQRKLCSSVDEKSKKGLSGVGSSRFLNHETPCDSSNVAANDQNVANLDDISRKELVDESPGKQESSIDKSWRALEKSLYEKGLEIFGRNSCLIARNLLNGLKTCTEVYQYMTRLDNKSSSQGGDDGTSFDSDENTGNDVRRRSRYVRRKGRVRRLKYSWKSTGYHSIRKRISERKDQPCRQFNPCGCQTACGKQCPCLLNGTCCEKYCGCPKNCKHRFRGCHCAKSQCRSRQCPCFAADRECDPDVCRHCWVSCGDGTLGTPNQRGDNYECRNMKLLLKQQQRVLLGRSDVSGWGAFLKNGVAKHEYLGEYTGELISHREADKRGKIYDRENSSFLFNLNDQFVLDAYRKGDKLKFANHSPDPNCYAKVIMVAGDHRVGIFAKERINGGEELFYDYRYEPDRAPAWARKPEGPGSKKDDAGPSTGRAKKLA